MTHTEPAEGPRKIEAAEVVATIAQSPYRSVTPDTQPAEFALWQFLKWFDGELAAARHEYEMAVMMSWNEWWLGVPYGPALNQTRPQVFRGLKALIEGDA